MSISQRGLPLELQRIILEELYADWYLTAHELETQDGLRLITLRPSSGYPVAPLLVNHQWHQYATGLLSRHFCGVLDVTATSLRSTRLAELSRQSATEDPPHPFKLVHDFGHLCDRVTTLRVDSCSMLHVALSILRKDLPMLERIEVVPTFQFRVYEYEISDSKRKGPPWTDEWDSWLKIWISFTWSCSKRNLPSLQSHRFSIFYKQIFVFEEFNAEKMVRITSYSSVNQKTNSFQLVVFDVTTSPFTIASRQLL